MTRALPTVLFSVWLSVALAAGCSSGTPTNPQGGPVPGAADEHCTVNGALQPTKVGLCMAPTASDAGATAEADGGAPVSENGETLFNNAGYDDECKYQVSFRSTPIRKDALVTFTVTLTGLDPAGPKTGADIDAEVTLGDTHVAPNTGTTFAETNDPGVYTVGPIKFDRSGDWVVRFHFFEECADEPADTPHGHVAFHIIVP